MIQLDLKDSSTFANNTDDSHKKNYDRAATSCIIAVDELQRQFSEGKVKLLSLSHYYVHKDIECPIWYKIENTITKHGKAIPNETIFYSSHYIGYCNIKDVSITIRPRFGEELQNYLLNFACNLYIPKGNSGYKSTQNHNPGFLLIALLWKAMLEKAIRVGQIPKQYIEDSKQISTFRGHLNIAKHIKTSLINASKFFCTYRKLTLNNIINQTIRYTFSILTSQKSEISSAIIRINEYDKKLAMFDVSNSPVKISDIDKIRYTKLNYAYKPVMSFSRAIIAHHEAVQNPNLSNAEFAYFIDMAEIWELYLLKLLQQNLSNEYYIYSPNARYGDYLLKNGYREIRPDIMIEKDNHVVMIIDAKYKNYKEFGQNSKYGVCREDLYQMSTYLYRYGKENDSIVGLFVSPVYNSKENDIHSFEHNPKHRIGLLNLNLEKGNTNIEDLKGEEENFIKNIKNILGSTK